VIAGYGRVGQSIGDILQQQQIAHVAVDLDAGSVSDLRKKGWPVHFGDASRREVMLALGADRASAILVTMDSSEAVEKIVAAAREAWPGVPVFARARDALHARRLHQAGAVFASPETTEATLQRGEALLGGIGLPDEAARRIIEERREQERLKTLAAPEA
jgi:CPA2 family monovalent cation:H+ antiporter-2